MKVRAIAIVALLTVVILVAGCASTPDNPRLMDKTRVGGQMK